MSDMDGVLPVHIFNVIKNNRITPQVALRSVIGVLLCMFPQRMGYDALAKRGAAIARALNLDHPDEYTGHWARATSNVWCTACNACLLFMCLIAGITIVRRGLGWPDS